MTQSLNYKRTKYTCFYTYLAMASAFSLPPVMLTIFHDMYGVSYTLLGTLVLVNFCTQLGIDLIFSFFSKLFNIHLTVKVMPLLTSAGLLIYALIPTLFPQYAYVGLVIGTVVFSIAAGLCEVLMSPLVASLPSDNPDRDMSALHSLYGYGVVTVVVLTTVALRILGDENWMYVVIFWAILPVISSVLFATSPLPEMNLSHDSETGSAAKRRAKGLALCVGCIFLGSAAENAMTNWISGYIESALSIPKVVADILGLAAFATLLALCRTAYAKYGKNIMNMLIYSMIGAAVCYLAASMINQPVVSMVFCVLTGLCTSMLWPGALIMMEENMPGMGVAAYALMAAGGDFGASVSPQLMGVVVDAVSASDWAASVSSTLSMTPDQIGMKVGVLTASLFPILGIFMLLITRRYFKKHKSL